MFHFHIYFTKDQIEQALWLRQDIGQAFPDLHIGKLHENPVGPHPMGSFAIDVPIEDYELVFTFLQRNARNLSVMIHPVTGDDIADHKDEKIIWIGPKHKILRHKL